MELYYNSITVDYKEFSTILWTCMHHDSPATIILYVLNETPSLGIFQNIEGETTKKEILSFHLTTSHILSSMEWF